MSNENIFFTENNDRRLICEVVPAIIFPEIKAALRLLWNQKSVVGVYFTGDPFKAAMILLNHNFFVYDKTISLCLQFNDINHNLFEIKSTLKFENKNLPIDDRIEVTISPSNPTTYVGKIPEYTVDESAMIFFRKMIKVYDNIFNLKTTDNVNPVPKKQVNIRSAIKSFLNWPKGIMH